MGSYTHVFIFLLLSLCYVLSPGVSVVSSQLTVINDCYVYITVYLSGLFVCMSLLSFFFCLSLWSGKTYVCLLSTRWTVDAVNIIKIYHYVSLTPMSIRLLIYITHKESNMIIIITTIAKTHLSRLLKLHVLVQFVNFTLQQGRESVKI